MPPSHSPTSSNIPGAVLNAVLLPGKLNMCHGSAQSLCARNSSKLDEIRNVLLGSKVEIACFTESWLTSKNSDRSIGVPGYAVLRNDRASRRGGGIVVYYRQPLTCLKVFGSVLTIESVDKTKCIGLELRVCDHKILLIIVYNPPENDCTA